METIQSQVITEEMPTSTPYPHFDDTTILLIFRVALYIIFAFKLLEICFSRRRKMRVNERIQRKFIFAHGAEMIKQFNQQENDLMNLTLKNTLKNATQSLPLDHKKNQRKRKQRVTFHTQKNKYYDPPSFIAEPLHEKPSILKLDIPPELPISDEFDEKVKKSEQQKMDEGSQEIENTPLLAQVYSDEQILNNAQ